jgi:ABC-2 type transport system permease protein
LLRADFTTQWRNRRSFILILLVPVIILISWKGVVDKLGGAFALSTCITIGLVAIGLMGYSNSIARDRDKGIFQRLRVAPVPPWLIMASRLSVQLIMIVLVTIAVFIAGYYFDNILISPAGYELTFLTSIIGGALYLGLGQVIVGLIKNPETVNSTTRLVYFIFIMVGMFGELGVLGPDLEQVVRWSPYGVVKKIVSAGMEPSTWDREASGALLVTVLYAAVFAAVGIRKFQWNAR